LSAEYFPNRGELYRINPSGNVIEATYNFTNSDPLPSRLRINPTKDILYFIESGIRKMAITDNMIPALPFIEFASASVYGLGVDPETGHIFVGDAKDFKSAGEVLIYNKSGDFVTSFAAGVAPSGFSFR
jgi:hypothetical protein